MTGFRRTSRTTHVVHAIHLPALDRSRRPALRRRSADGRASGPPREEGEAAAAPAVGAPAGAGADAGPRGRSAGRDARQLRPEPADARARFRVVRVSPDEVEGPAGASAAAREGAAPSSSAEASRVELLERRLAKLARLLEEREEALRSRMRAEDADVGVASRYTEVQGLRGDSEAVERKRALMTTLFEANRKLQERVGPRRAVAE